MSFKMERVLLMAAVMISFIFIASYLASAAPFLISDPQCKEPSVNANCAAGFEISKDGIIWIEADSQDVDADKIRLYHDLNGTPDGTNSWQVRAINVWGESDPVPFVFTSGAPSLPTGIVIAPE